MKTFTVIFIPNMYLNEDDPSDFKEWRDVEGESADDAVESMKNHAMVLNCTENK
jgi:hypothetical protein